ncbi:MAG: 30S ribosomal protein S2 [Candidatus Lokiarchaeota archaeon]|nr:30S ribosomal protein S2 [Candidatus Lokiarchaeota archaeon]
MSEEEEKALKKIDEGTEEAEDEESHLLINREEYLAAGVHIGTKLKTKHTVQWIYRSTSYGLYVIDLNATDERIRVAAKFLAKFDPKEILICSVRRYGRQPVRSFAEVIGATAIDKRFIPGTLTNPMIDDYFEAKVVFIIDPHADKQALKEAELARIPLISLIDTDDTLDGVDFAIPTNNRGRKALSLIMYLLARQIQREKGLIEPDGDLKVSRAYFESKIVPRREE